MLDGAKFQISLASPTEQLYSLLPLSEYRLRKFLLSKGGYEVYVDVGAYIGKYSIPWALANPSAQIIALEASEQTVKTLRRNATSNSCPNIDVIHACALDKVGEVVFPSTLSSTNSLSVNSDVRKSSPSSAVPALTLDQILDPYFQGLIPSVLFKIDVEGAELAVLAGCSNTLAKVNESLLVIECLPSSSTSNDVRRILSSAGFDEFPTLSGHNLVFRKTPTVRSGASIAPRPTGRAREE